MKKWSDYRYTKFKKGFDSTNFLKMPLTNKTAYELSVELISKTDKILDIGAMDRRFYEILKNNGLGECEYKTLDIDPETEHDYNSIDEIKEKFDIVVSFATIEHIELEEVRNYLERIVGFSNRLILTTNNTFFPAWGFFNAASHVQPYSPATIYSLLREAGYNEINITRISRTRCPRIRALISRLTYQDFAGEIFVFATTKRMKER